MAKILISDPIHEDALSQLMQSSHEIFDHSENKKNIEGDLYISIDRTKENAKKYKVDENTELIRVIIHGLLHLIGYKDRTKKEKTLMSEKENKYLSLYKQK